MAVAEGSERTTADTLDRLALVHAQLELPFLRGRAGLRAALEGDGRHRPTAVVHEPGPIELDGDRIRAPHHAMTYGAADDGTARLGDRVPCRIEPGAWQLDRDASGWATTVPPASSPDGLRGTALPACPRCRLAAAEDRWKIYDLLSRYGLAVDSGSIEGSADLVTEDVDLKIDGGLRSAQGRQGFRELIRSDFHQSMLPWAAHTMVPGHLVVDGDAAHSLHVSRVYRRRDERSSGLVRVAYNSWHLAREADGEWRIARRRTWPSRAAERDEVLRAALEETPPPGSCDHVDAWNPTDSARLAVLEANLEVLEVARRRTVARDGTTCIASPARVVTRDDAAVITYYAVTIDSSTTFAAVQDLSFHRVELRRDGDRAWQPEAERVAPAGDDAVYELLAAGLGRAGL